ncbi:MAG: NUDIX hydrolase [Candidatus Omnitrophica bacterium]|nr:NUDIX hydrolase [Candidatus Omnitrophota bacterium]
MSQEVLGHLRDGKSIFKEIIFCLYNKDDFDIFQKHALGYLDYVVNKLKGPYLTVDAIIEVDDRVVVIQRKNPPFGWALPGGFVDYGESVEEAVIREMKEETDLDLEGLKQFHTYSAYGRDPRFHTVAVVFTAKGKGKPQAGDDAGDLKLIKAEEIDKLNFAFDHNKILEDYFKSR